MRRLLAAALFLGAASAVAEAQTLPARFHQPVPVHQIDQTLFHEAVLVYANEMRKQHGRKALKADKRLMMAAAGHASNMAQLRTHSHRLPVEGQGRLVQRMDRQSVRYRTAGENIAMDKLYRLLGRPIAARANGCNFTYADTGEPVPVHTYASLAQQAVQRWMSSAAHRDSMLSKSFGRLGSGVAVDPAGTGCGDVYLVQNFAD